MQNSDEHKPVPVNHKKETQTLTITLVVIFALIVFVYSPLGINTHQTMEQYHKAGGRVHCEIPENATDCRFATFNFIITGGYFYSFELDKDSLEKHAADIVEKYSINKDDLDKKYGYGKWYGKQVKDCYDASFKLDNFPVKLPFFSLVIDDSIEDYKVILYYPTGAGNHSYGVLMNPNTYRVVGYSFYAGR